MREGHDVIGEFLDVFLSPLSTAPRFHRRGQIADVRAFNRRNESRDEASLSF
jgi:hypothetical protein